MNTYTTLTKGSWIHLNERQAARAGILLLLLLLLSLPAGLQAQSIYTNGLVYTSSGYAITITGYAGPGGSVAIPDRIPDAPYGLPVTSIAANAFYDCTSLTSVMIPASVTSIGYSAFLGCTNLTAINVDTGNPTFRSVAGVLFNKSQTLLVQCPEALAGAYAIPNSVTNIGDGAFYGCGSLTNVTISTNITSIGNGAFQACHGLTSVTIPDTVTCIRDQVFMECFSLTSVTIPNSVTSIWHMAFAYCTGLTNVMIPNSVISIGDNAFDDCISLTSITIPNSLTNIEYGVFGGCTSLRSFTIPSTIISIGGNAFCGCNSLTNITVPSSVTSIGLGAFAGCRLSAITVDALNSAYTSVDGVLCNKSQTTLVEYPGGREGSYTIPISATSIGVWAFWGCTSLSSVTIPNSVTSVGDAAFESCRNLASVTIGNGVTNIGSGAFLYCSSLTNVILPNSITTIAGHAFEGCSDLTSATIPDSVTSVGGATFQYCTSLTSVMIGNNVSSVGYEAFWGCSNLTTVTIPKSVTSLGYDAFYFCTGLEGVYFQGNAPSIDGDLFYGDTDATVYYLPGTTGWGTTFGGLPTAPWPPPTILMSPQTQTAEAGSPVGLQVQASGPLLFCLWYFNSTNFISCSTNCDLELTNVQFSQSGAYTAVITNAAGAVASSPAMLNVIAAVEHRPVPGVKVTGETASLLNVDYADSLSPSPNWTPLGSVSLTGRPQYCFDLTLPLPPQRFYRAWQTGTPPVMPSLDFHLVPAITMTGNIGHSVRLDYINQFGPIDAWVTLATVPLTNTSQLYFDISAPGQPQRLYRLVPSP